VPTHHVPPRRNFDNLIAKPTLKLGDGDRHSPLILALPESEKRCMHTLNY
jgi:hypothetical protein